MIGLALRYVFGAAVWALKRPLTSTALAFGASALDQQTGGHVATVVRKTTGADVSPSGLAGGIKDAAVATGELAISTGTALVESQTKKALGIDGNKSPAEVLQGLFSDKNPIGYAGVMAALTYWFSNNIVSSLTLGILTYFLAPLVYQYVQQNVLGQQASAHPLPALEPAP